MVSKLNIYSFFNTVTWVDPPICSIAHLLMPDNTYLCNKLAFHQQLPQQLLLDHCRTSPQVATLAAPPSYSIRKFWDVFKIYIRLQVIWFEVFTFLYYLMLYLSDVFEVEVMFSFWTKVFWMKSSTGVAKINSETAATSRAPVPTRVCFSNLMTGLTFICR